MSVAPNGTYTSNAMLFVVMFGIVLVRLNRVRRSCLFKRDAKIVGVAVAVRRVEISMVGALHTLRRCSI